MDSSANARLETLYRQCYPSLYRYALWALRDHHQAEEAVQETFLSALPKAAEVTALDRPEGVFLLSPSFYRKMKEITSEMMEIPPALW